MQVKSMGSLLSLEPVYLRRAAKYLSRFAASETGARPEIVAYVRRASEAFDELVQFHVDLKLNAIRSEVHGREQDVKRGNRNMATDRDMRPRHEVADGEVLRTEEGKDRRRRKRRVRSGEVDLEHKSRSLERRNEMVVTVERSEFEERKKKRDKKRNQEEAGLDEETIQMLAKNENCKGGLAIQNYMKMALKELMSTSMKASF